MEKCLTSIDKRMQKRHTPRIPEPVNDMDLLSHSDMREATPLLLLAVHFPSNAHGRERKCTRVEPHGRLKQECNS